MILFLCVIFFPFTRSQNTGYPCGKPNNIPSSERVVGGYEVGYYKYPWFAALTADDEVGCGGTLISPRTVLTAAHCFKPYFKNIIEGQTKVEDVYTIKLGMYNRCKNESTQRSFRATKVELHENYYEEMPYFDIALITLDGDTKGYTPVCLPEAVMQSETRGKEGTIQGFGRLTYENDTSPCILQEAHLLIHPDSRCRLMLNSTENNGSALQHAFCAGYLEGKVDSCMGDSGGPFLIQNKNGQYVQLGITSFGFGCAQKDVLGVYTDVSHFTDWIYEKLNTNNKTSNATSVGVSVQSSTTTNSISSIHSAIGGINITINDDIKFLKELLHTTIQPIVFALHHPKRRRKRPWRKRRPLRYYYYNRRLNSSNHYKHSTQKHA